MYSFKSWTIAGVGAVVVLTALARTPFASITAQTPGQSNARSVPLLKHSFDETDHGWNVMGPSASASITRESAGVHSGTGSLKFNYKVTKGEMNGLVCPRPEAAPAKLKSFHFWVKSDYDATLAFMVSEKEPGGRYMSTFYAPAGKWQEVEIALGFHQIS